MEDRFKFRHYNKLVKKMTYYDRPEMQVCLNNDFKSGLMFPISEDYEDNAMYIGNYTYYQQCTGLKDKNGKLIYEGDIVYKKSNKDHKGNKMFSTVVWCSMYAEFNISDENGLHRMPSNPNNVEIIGNIYESPELLEKNNVQ